MDKANHQGDAEAAEFTAPLGVPFGVPFGVAVATALVSCGLLAVAIAKGWLGADAGRGANFCEAARDGLVRQPANTFSNLGFVAAGLLIAWHARTLRGGRGLATGFACLVVLLGPGSAAMHATQSAAGGHLDMASMYLVASAVFSIWNATRTWLCDPHSPVQGHAVWHLLGAVSAYLLYRYYAWNREPARQLS